MTHSATISLYIKSHTDGASLAEDEARAKEAATLLADAADVALLDSDGAWNRDGPDHALSPGVVVVTSPASYDAAGNQLTPARLEDGWFANLRLRAGLWDVAALAAQGAHLGVELRAPLTPAQVWQTGVEAVTR